MGFDVTFHPVSEAELRRFFFDVIEDPKLAEPRAAELCKTAAKRKKILRIYTAVGQLAQQQAGMPELGFMAAVLAGYLHPFWYARGQGFSLLPREQVPEAPKLFQSFRKLGCAPLAHLDDPSTGVFLGNESGSGLIPASRIGDAERLLDALGDRRGRDGLPILRTAFDEDGLASLRAALAYCRANQLGMIEASDVAVPLGDQCWSDGDNLRAPFLGTMDP